MTPCSILTLAMCVLLTVLDLAGFWMEAEGMVERRKGPMGFVQWRRKP